MSMNNVGFFPTFHFHPKRLQESSDKIYKKYKDDSQLFIDILRKRLPDLLTIIRTLGEDPKEIRKFASTLKAIDINVLASGYPYDEEDLTTASKVLLILVHRYNKIVGRRFWQHFQTSPYDHKIIEMLVYVFGEEDTNFMGLKEEVRNKYNHIFFNSKAEEVLINIALKIDPTIDKVKNAFKDLRIEADSLLAHELWLLILEYNLNTRQFIELQGIEVIRNTLNNVHMNRYKQIIVNYLHSFESEEYHQLLFTQLIQRLNDPRKNNSRWDNVSDEIIKKVKQRLISGELYDFFGLDSERFTYWSKYIDYIDDVDFNEDPLIAAMHFGEFVVVEFANKGNAAYFYEQKGFSKYLAHKVRRDIHESELKDRNAGYYIHKLNHAGDWPSRYDGYMANFLNGNLDYRH